MNGIYTKGRRSQRISTSSRWFQHLLEKSGPDEKLNRITTLLCPTKACEGLVCYQTDISLMSASDLEIKVMNKARVKKSIIRLPVD